MQIKISLIVYIWIWVHNAWGFCGFFVAKGGTDLFNKASKVVIARDENRTVFTMSSDYQGELKDFAIVIPVPTVLQKSQINVGDSKLLDHLDAYTAPRLVEYFDSNPCEVRMLDDMVAVQEMSFGTSGAPKGSRKKLGVKIEAQYTVGEYDILILSAKESSGLITWLKQNDFKMPKGAESVLNSYIKQGLKFFVAKVNLKEQSKLGYSFLRPLQMAYESERFMLPVRLGTLNAQGEQDLFLFTLTKTGRVESSNYRTTKLPSNVNIPGFVKKDFGDFYHKTFSEAAKKEDYKTMILEYAWDMNWCDPCAADPLSNQELLKLGVFWLDQPAATKRQNTNAFRPPNQAKNVYVTRYHIRYNSKSFPEDIMLKATPNRENFQGRYIINHPFKGEANCDEGKRYFSQLPEKKEKWAQNMASLTGMDINQIRAKMDLSTPAQKNGGSWWNKVFDNKDKNSDKGPKEEKKSWWQKIFQ